MSTVIRQQVLSFQQASLVHRAIADDFDHGGALIYPFLRQYAAKHLLADGWPEDEGMGTSDISIHLTELLRTFDVPLVAPVFKAYGRCGFIIPATAWEE